MPQTQTVITYTFGELPPNIQDKVLEEHTDINVDYEWWDNAYDTIKDAAHHVGLEISQIHFDGVDGNGNITIVGRYAYATTGVQRVKAEFPQDTNLHNIVQDLQAAQQPHFYRLYAHLTEGLHGTHIEVYDNATDCTPQNAEYLTQALRGFCSWAFYVLVHEYEYLTSRDSIIETLKENKYQFTADGRIFY